MKELIKENNIGHQTAAHMDSFTRNESIINPREKNINIQNVLHIQGSYYISICFFNTVTLLTGFII